MAIKFLSGQTISGTLTVSGNVQGATFNGLPIETSQTNNNVNKIVRTTVNGYVNFGWINSISGNHTGSITRITASNDQYLRYVTPAQFRTGVTDGFYAPSSTVTGVTSVTGTGTVSGLTLTGTVTSTGNITLGGAISGFTELNMIRSLGTTAFTNGTNPNITTAEVMAEIEADGGFDSYSSVFKTSWSYAGNYNLTDAGDFTETAGSSWITWTDNSSDTTRGNITTLAIAPTTGGSAGGVFIYNDQGSGYAPGWRQVWTSTTDGSGSGLDADLLDGQQGSYYLDWNNFTNKPTIPSVGDGQIDGRTSGLGISGSMDATANQTGNTTFTVTSNAVEAATASTLVYRNSSADINVRLLRANYQDQGTISGAIAFRVNNSSDNYTRYCSSTSAIRTFLGVPASGDLGNYLPLAGGTMTGPLLNRQILMNRSAGAGGQMWYATSYTSWQNYMNPGGAGAGYGANITAPTGTYVTSWALRSFIENATGYGWTWEGGTASSTTPSIVAELASSTGNFKTIGNIYASGGSLSLSGYNLTSTVGLNLKVDSGNVSAITIDNVGSTTFSGYTYFPNYLFHAGDTNTRIQFTTGTVTLRGDTSILLDGPVTANSTMTVASTLTANGQITANSSIYLKDRITLPASGLSSASGTPPYAIYQTPGAWTSPFPDLNIVMHTGIRMAANSGYGGFRFYSDYNTLGTASAQIMSINNSADGNGAGNVYINSICNAGASMRSPIFYDSNNTAYYGDFASTSNMFQGYYKGKTAGWSLQLGDANITRVYNDSARASLVINAAYYPHLYINSNTDVGNLNHGAVFSMSGNISGGGFRRWSMGIPNSNPNMLTIGTADNNTNPHYGCGGDVLGEATWGSKFWLDSSSNLQTNGSMRSPIFYDSANTAYYLDPGADISAILAGSIGIGTTTPIVTAWGSATTTRQLTIVGSNYGVITLQGSATALTKYSMGVGGNTFYMAYDNVASRHNITINSSGQVVIAVDIRAPIFYDSLNTSYYVDPSSISNVVTFRSEALGTNTSGSQTNQNGLSLYGAYSGGQPTYGVIFSGISTNGAFGGVNTDWATYFTMNGTTGRGWVFKNVGSGGPIASITNLGWAQFAASVRTPIFYDSDNTAYYGNFASTSQLNVLNCAGTLTVTGAGGVIAPKFTDYNNGSFYLDPSSTGTSLNVAGDVVAYASSDIRFKNNVLPITNALDKINKIGGYTFEWNEKSHKETGKKDIGVIAQEVEDILPEIVDTRDNGYKAVDYSKLTALLIQSVKEQQVIIDNLKSRIETLENN